MKKKTTVLMSAFCCMLMVSQVFAMELPKYYQYLSESKYEKTSKTNNYEPGYIFYVTTGPGRVYYVMCEDGVGRLCTPDGEMVTYEEVQEYFGVSSEDTAENEVSESNAIPEEKEAVRQSEQSDTAKKNQSVNNSTTTGNYGKSTGDPTLGRELGDISMGNHPLAPYYGSDIIVPRPAKSQYPPVAKTIGASNFSDINGHWAESYIKQFASKGYISGDPDGRFRPDVPISYAEFVSIVARFDLRPVRWQGGFFDSWLFKSASFAKESDWYFNACMIVSEAGLFGNKRIIERDSGDNGYTAYSLPKITEPAQRQHIAQFAVNLLEYKESDLNTVLRYQDENQINKYSDGVIYNAVKRLVNNDIISGYPDGSFRPEGTITRAELVVLLTKILDKYQWDMDTISNNMYGNYNLWNWEQDKLLGELVNTARLKAGVSILKQDRDLSALAEIRVIEKTLYGYTSGSEAHGSKFYGDTQQKIAESFGYQGSVGENALMAKGTAESSHDIWMNSEAHKRNLLKDIYIYGGFAIGEDCAFEMFSLK